MPYNLSVVSFVTDAVVLGAMRYGEADRIITLLTVDHGRLNAIAKSARKPNSSFHASTESFIQGRFELAEGRSLAILRHAEIINPHLKIRDSWSRLQLAGHVCEISAKMGEEKHPDPELYAFTCAALESIDKGDPKAVLIFKVSLLDHMGVFPELGGCVRCESRKAKGQVHLDERAGGFLCADCAKETGCYRPVPMEVLHVLNAVKSSMDVPDATEDTLDLAEDLLTQLLQAFLQAGFKTVAAARQARSAERERTKTSTETNDDAGIPA